MAKEGPITLPKHISVKLRTGQQVFLGPKLTTPKSGPMADRTTISMHQTEEATIIKLAEKKPTEEDEETDMSDSEDQSSEEEDETQKESKEDATDEEGNDVLNREKQEKKAQLKQEDEQEHKENQEDKRDKKAEAKQSREDSQRTFQNDDDDMAKMLYVSFGEKRVTKEDINKHFSQFGRVLDVLVPCEGLAMVTFQSASLAQWLGVWSVRPYIGLMCLGGQSLSSCPVVGQAGRHLFRVAVDAVEASGGHPSLSRMQPTLSGASLINGPSMQLKISCPGTHTP